MAKIAVILPTYHRPHSLEYAIQSVIRQTFKQWRLYVIGDGCTDNTENIVNKYKSRHPNKIIWHNLPQNHGGKHTNKIVTRGDTGACPRNTGFFMSKEPYICYLDDDDAYRSNHLYMLYSTIKMGSSFAFSQGAVWRKPNINQNRPRIVGGPTPVKCRIGTNSLIHTREIGKKILIKKAAKIRVPSTGKVYNAGGYLLKYDCCKKKPGILWLPAKICDGCHDWDIVKRMLDVGARWRFARTVTYDIYWDMSQAQFLNLVIKNTRHRRITGAF